VAELRKSLKLLLLAGLSGAGLLGGVADAADLAVAPIYRPPIAYFSWTGCYAGGNVGGLWANRAWTDQIPGDPLFGTDFGRYTQSGVLGGVQAGCNYQFGGWVIGAQADYYWSGGNAHNTPPSPFAPNSLTDAAQLKSLASVTGRIGYAWDRFLGYIRAGGAWEASSYDLLVTGVPAATATEHRGGWTVGIGGEYAFLDWLTGFIEYDYYGFSGTTSTFICPACGLAAVAAPFSIRTNISTLKLGLNFKFNPGI
jgi:outer membrane immunogenic protein